MDSNYTEMNESIDTDPNDDCEKTKSHGQSHVYHCHQ